MRSMKFHAKSRTISLLIGLVILTMVLPGVVSAQSESSTTTSTIDKAYFFGASSWTPIVGDWNSDGKKEIGVYNNGTWYLDMNGDGVFGDGDKKLSFGSTGWTPVLGNWNGDGKTEIGVYNNGTWYLDMSGNGVFGDGDKKHSFGSAGWTPVVGDWNGDGKTEIGVTKDGAWNLDMNGDGIFRGSTSTTSTLSTSTPSLSVTSPKGGESWVLGSNHSITWTFSGNVGSYVKIELLKAGIVIQTLSTSTPNDGTFSWTISTGQAPGTDYRIRVTSTTNTAITDTSNSNVTITKTSSVIKSIPTAQPTVKPTTQPTTQPIIMGEGSFGAESNPTGSPVGGGAGYLHVVTSGTYTVTTASQLIAAAASATNGQTIFIPSTASIDMTGQNTLVIKSGVTLASDRGYNGHSGALIYRKDLTPGGWQNGMITAKSNSRITGLRIQGFQSVYNGDYGDWAQLTTGIGVTDQTGVEIDNNEIYYFSYNGVMLRHTSTTSNSNWVHHNYIHHVAARGEGYGIGVCRGTALIEANHFDYVRHAVSGVGYAGESYEARYNLHGTHNLDSNYDVHAADQSGSEWDGSTPSGRLYKIHHNTIPSAVDGYESLYYVAPPTEGMYIYHNILGSRIRAYGGTTRLFMTNNYVGGVFRSSGQ